MVTTQRAWRYETLGRGSAAVKTLESAWELLRQIVPGVPPAVLTFVDMRSRGRVRRVRAKAPGRYWLW